MDKNQQVIRAYVRLWRFESLAVALIMLEVAVVVALTVTVMALALLYHWLEPKTYRQDFHTAALPGASTMTSSMNGMAAETFTSKIQTVTCLS